MITVIKDSMGIRSSKQAVRDLNLVWVPKYLKYIFDVEMRGYVKEIFQRIAEEYEYSMVLEAF